MWLCACVCVCWPGSSFSILHCASHWSVLDSEYFSILYGSQIHNCVFITKSFLTNHIPLKRKTQSVQFIGKISAGMPQIHYAVHDNVWCSVWCPLFIHPWSFPFTFTIDSLTRTSISSGREHVRLHLIQEEFCYFLLIVFPALLSSSVRVWQPGIRFIHLGNQTSFITLW